MVFHFEDFVARTAYLQNKSRVCAVTIPSDLEPAERFFGSKFNTLLVEALFDQDRVSVYVVPPKLRNFDKTRHCFLNNNSWQAH